MGFLGESNDMIIWLVIILLLFNGTDGIFGESSDNIIIILVIFFLLFNGSGHSGHC